LLLLMGIFIWQSQLRCEGIACGCKKREKRSKEK